MEQSPGQESDRRNRYRRQADESRALLAAVVESSNDAVVSTDLDGRITVWNAAASRLYGHAAEQAEGQDIWFLLPPEGVAEFEDLLRRVLRGEALQGHETEHLRRDGASVPVSLTLSAIRSDEGSIIGLSMIARDISERLRAAAELRQSQERYHSLFEHSRDGIFVTSWDGRLLAANPALCELLGHPFEVLRTLPPERIYVDPSDQWRLLDDLRRDGYASGREVRLRCADGRIRDVIITASPWESSDGWERGVQGILHDITDRKHLETQLLHSQKMEALGRLAGGVAHDFNNLLTVITGNTELLLGCPAVREAMLTEVEEIAVATRRASSLTRQLLAFSRKQVVQPRVLDVASVVEEMDRMLRRLIGEDVEFECCIADGAGRVRMDRSQLDQVIINLVVNARQAMPAGGRVRVAVRNVELGPQEARVRPEVVPGPHVLLTVEDTGNGIPLEMQERIFEPFFTTKEGGTGLGLSTVYGIIRGSGGHLWVESEPGQGSRFCICLPRLEPVQEAAVPAAPLTLPQGGRETVLLVEDEVVLRRLTRRILELAGYRVLEADSGAAALALSEGFPAGIDLLLTDVVMPGMNGWELASQLVQSRPRVRPLFTSGYTADTILHHDRLERGEIFFLEKPFGPDALLRKVREVLDRAA